MSFFARTASLLRLVRKENKLLFRCQSGRQIPRLSKAQKQKSHSFGEGGYILLVIPVTTFCLGTWQVKRREWKLGLIANLEERTQHPAIPLPLDLDELNELEYRKVTVRGKFDHSREMAIGPRSNVSDEGRGGLINPDGPSSGVNIVTPFILTDRNLTILVNRGWVPTRQKDQKTRSGGQVEGELTLTGLVRHNDKRPPFMPKGNAKSDGYYMYRNIDEMSQVSGTHPVFIDADYASTVQGGPLGGQTRVTLRNEHAAYIITWYTLSICTFVMWYRRFRRPPAPDSAFNYLKKQP